jgi:hypothetical protein
MSSVHTISSQFGNYTVTDNNAGAITIVGPTGFTSNTVYTVRAAIPGLQATAGIPPTAPIPPLERVIAVAYSPGRPYIAANPGDPSANPPIPATAEQLYIPPTQAVIGREGYAGVPGIPGTDGKQGTDGTPADYSEKAAAMSGAIAIVHNNIDARLSGILNDTFNQVLVKITELAVSVDELKNGMVPPTTLLANSVTSIKVRAETRELGLFVGQADDVTTQALVAIALKQSNNLENLRKEKANPTPY